jgi:hypothetical protein
MNKRIEVKYSQKNENKRSLNSPLNLLNSSLACESMTIYIIRLGPTIYMPFVKSIGGEKLKFYGIYRSPYLFMGEKYPF